MDKSPDAFRTISEVADWLGVQAHVLRFWESKFSQVKPVKRAGGRRYYRPADMALIGGIKTLLHDQGMTIKGVQKTLREEGVAHVSSFSPIIDDMPAEADDLGQNVLRFQGRPAEDTDGVADLVDMAEDLAAVDENMLAEAVEKAEHDAEDALEDLESAQAKMAAEWAEAVGPDSDGSAPSIPETASPAKDAPPAMETAANSPADTHRPRIVDAPDPPPLEEIAVTPGALALVGGMQSLDAETKAKIVPLVARLAALRDRMSSRDIKG